MLVMKFQRTSLVLVFVAIALGGFVYYTESKKPPQVDAAKSDEKPLFNFREQDVQALTVQTPKQTLVFEKASSWSLKKPEIAPADAGAIAFLLNLLATGKSDRTFVVPPARKAEFGLDQPSATVEVKLSNQQQHRLILGKPNFNRNFLYALVDPPENQNLSVLLIPINFQNAIDRPLAEWKRDQPKPNPSISPSASPSPQ